MSHQPEIGGGTQKSRFSVLHTRTHEAELLVSGAVDQIADELVVAEPSHEMGRGDPGAKPDRHLMPFWR